MKARVLIFLICASSCILAQGVDNSNRGPINVLGNGVVDGVVLKEELPVRSKIEYEHVREADYVWSKRVFSRIDRREKINHVIFFPDDFFEPNSYLFPSSPENIDKGGWIKHQERFSLWTVIMKHIMLGDLTIFEVSDTNFTLIEDGYQFKYPILKNGKNDFFDNPKYRRKASRKISYGSSGETWSYQVSPDPDDDPVTVSLMRDDDNESFDAWVTRLTTSGKDASNGKELYQPLLTADNSLRTQYDNAKGGETVKFPDNLQYINSACITAYNIKEDWFFDKERSILDRRIISIAPVARLKPLEGEASETDGINRFSSLIGVDRRGNLIDGKGDPYLGNVVEKELFWLYFPELRDVIVNYYTYNDNSDSQWMSFDDLFWKRKFSSTIYRVSDKFDREIEDYKYGVDALYEAERIKDDIRTWEIDVWNY